MGIIMGMGIIIDEFKDINYSLDFLCLHMGIAMGINYLMKLMWTGDVTTKWSL